jgi:hypothetical protein
MAAATPNSPRRPPAGSLVACRPEPGAGPQRHPRSAKHLARLRRHGLATAGWVRLLVFLLLVLVAGCKSAVDPDLTGRILVVNAHGVPIPGATVLPYDESESRKSDLTPEDRKALTTDPHGLVTVLLESYYWSEDGCYHFRVHRTGFDTATETVSKDLFPAELRIELKAEGQP